MNKLSTNFRQQTRLCFISEYRTKQLAIKASNTLSDFEQILMWGVQVYQCLLTYQRKLWMIFGVRCKEINATQAKGSKCNIKQSAFSGYYRGLQPWLLHIHLMWLYTLNLYLSFLFLLEMESYHTIFICVFSTWTC